MSKITQKNISRRRAANAIYDYSEKLFREHTGRTPTEDEYNQLFFASEDAVSEVESIIDEILEGIPSAQSKTEG